MDAIAIAGLIHWVLGLLTVSIVGIIAMHVRIAVFVQRLISHEERCLEIHQQNKENFKDLWSEINALKK